VRTTEAFETITGLTDVTALPHLLTFARGENVSIFVTAINAGGES